MGNEVFSFQERLKCDKVAMSKEFLCRFILVVSTAAASEWHHASRRSLGMRALFYQPFRDA